MVGGELEVTRGRLTEDDCLVVLFVIVILCLCSIVHTKMRRITFEELSYSACGGCRQEAPKAPATGLSTSRKGSP